MRSTLSPPDRKRHCINSWMAVQVQWGKEVFESTGRLKSLYAERRKVGHQKLVAKLIDDSVPPVQVAQEMWALFPLLNIDPNVCKPKVEVRVARVVPLDPPVRTIIVGKTGKPSLQRIPWERGEDDVLKQAKREGKSFRQIMDQLPRRRLCDAYDRWKIIRHHPDVAPQGGLDEHEEGLLMDHPLPLIDVKDEDELLPSEDDEDQHMHAPPIDDGDMERADHGRGRKKKKKVHQYYRYSSDIDDAICF